MSEKARLIEVVQDCKANAEGTFTDSVSGTNIVGEQGDDLHSYHN